ncbi:hypothetical protein TRFO_35300 [Tritrichomonas foetus]|uniref:KATNIP domain-containing protein n=1 Tax=Tritrichomonas foetus TaxID=1144522 RepID=A0A1J4JL72_9EUKA|nr:hypothetical protein TRFO_35300 [Tritrichomonas foetus]|eukprot:OHS98301.1 hypothetical protein TRFO_35300 [Tritrichomonas foetus]
MISTQNNATKSCIPIQTIPNILAASLVKDRVASTYRIPQQYFHQHHNIKIETANYIANIIKKQYFKENRKSKSFKKPFGKAIKYEFLPKADYRIIAVKFTSTWGNSSHIKLAFISLFDQQQKPIEVCFISSIPEVSSLTSLESILDTTYGKEDEQIFCEKFNDSFTIFLAVDKNVEVKTIRIFNPRVKSESDAKDVKVFEGPILFGRGEVPQKFGVNLAMLPEIYKSPSKNIKKFVGHQDQFGTIPFKKYETLKITILETYNSRNIVGLNGFSLFDENGELIDRSNVEKVKFKGICNLKESGMLLKRNKYTSEVDDMFLGDVEKDKTPTFEIKFLQPIIVSKIEIWNFNACDVDLSFGIKRIKLHADDIFVTNCIVPIGNGSSKLAKRTVKSIPLNDCLQNMKYTYLDK